MKKFLAVYTGTKNSPAQNEWNSLSEKDRKEREKAGMDAWGAWVHANQKNIVDGGAPLGKTKKISKIGIADITNELAAFVVVQADSYDAAAKMFLNHPHFSIFPGEGVEIMEFLEIPKR